MKVKRYLSSGFKMTALAFPVLNTVWTHLCSGIFRWTGMLIWVKRKDEGLSTLWLENGVSPNMLLRQECFWTGTCGISLGKPAIRIRWVMKRVTLKTLHPDEHNAHLPHSCRLSLLLLNHAEFCLPNGSTIGGPIVLMCINKGPFWVRRRLEWLFEYSKIMTIPTSKINMFSVSCTLYSGATLALTKLSISSSENTSGSDCFLIHVSKAQLWKMSWHFSSVSSGLHVLSLSFWTAAQQIYSSSTNFPKQLTVTVNFAKNTTLEACHRELVNGCIKQQKSVRLKRTCMG